MDAIVNGFCHAMGAMVAVLIVFAVVVAVAFALLGCEEEVENDVTTKNTKSTEKEGAE